MTTLYERLTARIDELERIARACLADAPTPWTVTRGVGVVRIIRDHSGIAICSPVEADAEHIAAWDPATVLRGLEEDRDILQRHALPDRVPIEDLPPYPCEWCSRRASDPAFSVWVDWPCEEIRSLARRHGVEVDR